MRPQCSITIVSPNGDSSISQNFHVEDRASFLEMCEELYNSIINCEHFVDVEAEIENMTPQEKAKLYKTFLAVGGMDEFFNAKDINDGK